MKKSVILLLLAGLLPCLTGCLTPQVWKSDFLSDRHWVSTNAEPKFFHTPDGRDVLVRYSEEHDANEGIKRRSYLLFANEKALASGRKPVFLREAKADHLCGEPLEISHSTNPKPAFDESLRVVFRAEEHQFSLLSDGAVIGTYELPAYASHHNVARLVLTPAAVLGDATIVGGVVGINYLSARAGGGILWIPDWKP